MEVHVNLLGQFELLLDRVEVTVRSKKTAALLAWLVLHQGKAQSRTKLAHLLWAESGAQQGRQSLRQSVADLRRILGDAADVLVADNERIILTENTLYCDVIRFQKLAISGEEADLEAATELYRGALLESLGVRSDVFDEWLTAEQSRLLDLNLGVIGRLVDSYRHTDTNQAIRYGQMFVNFDPLQGQMHRRLMELYRDAGRPEDAIRQFKTYKEFLQRELGVPPEAEAEGLLEEILSARQNRRSSGVKSSSSTTGKLVRRSSSELRQVAAIAIYVKNLGELSHQLDEEAFASMTTRTATDLAEQLKRYGAVVVQNTTEMIVALLGIPVATGSEIQRSMEAALAVRDRFLDPRSIHPDLAIAIGSGQVIVNVNEKLEAAQGAVITQVAELARQANAGEVIAPADLIEAVAMVVDHDNLSEPVLSGVCCVVRINSITRERVKTPFSGRHLQMQQLRLALQACSDTNLGQTILIRGEPGLGKSRLVGELMREARERGFAAARSNLSEQTNDNISNLTRLVTTILEFDTYVTPDEIHDEDLVRLGMSRGQRTALIDLLDLEMPDSLRAYWDSTGDERRQEIRRASLESIVANATRENPVLTVIEDLQWAEPSILARIGVLASIVSEFPMVLLLTSRLDESLDDLSWRGPSQKAPFMTLDLSPLRAAEALELGRHIHEDDEVVKRCFARSGGNPLFLEQLLRGYVVSNHHIPDSIQALVEASVYQLPNLELDAIQAAAVLGHEFSEEALTWMVDKPDYSAATLLRQHLLVKSGEKFEFSHALIRESTYNTLLRSRRSALHLKAAAYYKKLNRSLYVDHLLSAESDEAPAELLAIAQQEQKMHRHDRARILVRKGLTRIVDEKTRKAFKQMESDLLSADPGWEDLVKAD